MIIAEKCAQKVRISVQLLNDNYLRDFNLLIYCRQIKKILLTVRHHITQVDHNTHSTRTERGVMEGV